MKRTLNHVKEKYFQLHLPEGEWLDYSTPEMYDFQLSGNEQINIVCYVFKEEADPNTIQKATSDLYKLRIDAFSEMSCGRCEWDEPWAETFGKGCKAYCFGFDHHNQVRIYFEILSTPVVSIAVSYYTMIPYDHDEFSKRATLLSQSITPLSL